MRRKVIKKFLRRGVSDLVVILALVAIAIPVMITVQQWLSSQTGKVTSYVSIPSLYATVLSRSKTETSQAVTIKIENKGGDTYVLSNQAKVIFSNGTTVTVQATVIAGDQTIAPGSSSVVLIKVDSISEISSIVLEFTSKSTGGKEVISVSLK